MIVTPAETIAGKRLVSTIGLVRASSIRSRHFGHKLLSFIKQLFGGEIEEYSQLLAETREHAIGRLIENARALGANAITHVRFSSSEVLPYAAEVLVYGNAVVVEGGPDE